MTKNHQKVYAAVLLAAGIAARAGAQAPDRGEPDSMANPLVFTPGGAVSRTFHIPGDIDWFLIRPDGNRLLILETSGDIDTIITLYDTTSGEALAEDDDSGNGYNARIEVDVAAGQILLAKVWALDSATGSYQFQGNYETTTAWEEPNNSMTEAKPVNPGEIYSARFQTGGDHDWYQIKAGSGMLVVWTEGGLDTVMTLYDVQGNQLAHDDDSGDGMNARCMAVVSGGPVFIELYAYGGGTGSYRFCAEMRAAPPPDQYENDDTAPRAKEIAVGTPQERTFTLASDNDWARFTVRQAGNYAIRAVGYDTSLDTVLQLYSVEQDLLAEDDDGGSYRDSLIRRRLQPGTYLIRVYCISSDPLSDNRYSLSVSQE